MKHNSIFLIALCAIFPAVSSCVYPFDPVIESEAGRLVVEGDIHIGSVSTFTFSQVYPLDLNESVPGMHNFKGYIEGEDGTRVEAVSRLTPGYYSYSYNETSLVFDTTELPADQRYRVHFESVDAGMVYESDWLDVNPAPVIDDLSYILDRDRDEFNVALSMHCNGRSHFRWYYDEQWEYHTRKRATSYYDPVSQEVKDFVDDENTYYCWSTYHSPDIKIFSTEDQVDDRFVDLEFHRFSRSSQKIQVMYKITVYLEAIDEEGYKYWNNIRQNSENQGSIFSPMPSQMAGNLHCVTDPSVMVIGYVSAAVQAEAEMYYNDLNEFFYKEPYEYPVEVKELKPAEFELYYNNGYKLYQVLEEIGAKKTYEWVIASCVDCRMLGGTKDKPAGWPNDHK